MSHRLLDIVSFATGSQQLVLTAVAAPAQEVPAPPCKHTKRNTTTQAAHSSRSQRSTERPQLQLLSKNVQGLVKNSTSIGLWFDSFRRRRDGHPVDIILLQETRGTTKWTEPLCAQWSRSWGYDPYKSSPPFSYWPPTEAPFGGVAILLSPHSALENVVSWMPEQWSAYFVAVSGEMCGERISIANVYGPTDKATREEFFSRLAELPPPPGLLLLGGDFNCTLDNELDRSYQARGSHHSPALVQLLSRWNIVDCLTNATLSVNTPEEVRDFHETHHTFAYPIQGDGLATAQLDRWYVSEAEYIRVRGVIVEQPGQRSDHDSVRLVLGDRRVVKPCSRRRARALKFPLPKCAAAAILSAGQELLLKRGPLLTTLPAPESASGWDSLKVEIRRTSLTVRRERLAGATKKRRDQVKRLQRALKDVRVARRLTSLPPDATVEEVADHLALLSLDPRRLYKLIRQKLVAIQTSSLEQRQLARHSTHAGPTHESAKAFYRRISTKFSVRRVTRLPRRPETSRGPADWIADDWKPITQRAPCDMELQDAFFATLPTKPELQELKDLDTAITVSEVAAAIKACPRGKACGPDGLPNDWYRENEGVLAEILAPLFSKWYRAGILPPSFKAAAIYCIPKKHSPQSGLDFRPIALLNTDYKIYARVLLNRIRHHIPKLVAKTQFGFVPWRQAHDALDIWSALQMQHQAKEHTSTALAVMLDFAKAYDTLDRRFLDLALRWHGFSSMLIQTVHAMHLGTTAQYLADDQISKEVDITTRIRQGCPLAPTLFILAVDALYVKITASSLVRGLQLSNDTVVKIVGFADDTTIYLRSAVETAALRSLLFDFAQASGLCVNVDKSIGVCLDARYVTQATTLSSFPTAGEAQLVRYLGRQISSTPRTDMVWQSALQKLQARLHLAELKTTDLLQRVQVCQTIVVPKILFVARHSWPSARQISKLQLFVDNYVWSEVLSATKRKGRGFMSRALATAPRQHGGLQLPSIRDELILMAAGTVQRWTSATDKVAAEVGRILLGTLSIGIRGVISPGRRLLTSPRVGASLVHTGLSAIRLAACTPASEDERSAVTDLLSTAGRAPPSAGFWLDGWYQRDYSLVHNDLKKIRNIQRARAGRLNRSSLLRAPILGADVLLHQSGSPLRESDLPGLHIGSGTIAELIDIKWVSPTRLHFRPIGLEYPHPGDRSFRLLCDTIVFCYPELLLPHDPPNQLRERGRSTDLWSLHERDGAVHLIREVAIRDLHDLGPVSSLRHAESLARRATGSKRLQFVPHPMLSPILPLWGDAERLSKRSLRHIIFAPRQQQCERELEERRSKAESCSLDFSLALDQVDWSEIHSLEHSSSRQRLIFHKVKGQRLSGWDRSSGRIGCPHCPTVGSEGGSTYHIVWQCSAAQRLWNTVRAWWQRFGLWHDRAASTTTQFLSDVFSLRLSSTPPKIWDLATLHRSRNQELGAAADPFPVLQAVWQQLVLETLVFLSTWRSKQSYGDNPWTFDNAAVLHDASCHRVLTTLNFRFMADRNRPEWHAALVGDLRTVFRSSLEFPPPVQLQDRAMHLLFFDGGSRGNPGPGGAGAVLVRAAPHSGAAEIIWSAATSLASPRMTNNQAEYQGLLVGLRKAHSLGLSSLQVIGDSALVLRQMREHRPPRNSKLLVSYNRARQLADRLGIQRWIHQARAHNRMADAMANLAMDSRHSAQVNHPTNRDGHTDLPALLANDLRPWWPLTGLPVDPL